jgi:hypothetical protein
MATTPPLPITYTSQPLLVRPDHATSLHICSRCGAVVARGKTGTHSKWHADADAVQSRPTPDFGG